MNNKTPFINIPPLGSRWTRKAPWDPTKGEYNGYTVLFVTNVQHPDIRHPPQIVYRGDNGFMWSIPASSWPGGLREEIKEDKTQVLDAAIALVDALDKIDFLNQLRLPAEFDRLVKLVKPLRGTK